MEIKVSPIAEYQEHHVPAEDVGVAWNSNRIWVCVDGVALLRAKIVNGQFIVNFDDTALKIIAKTRTEFTSEAAAK